MELQPTPDVILRVRYIKMAIIFLLFGALQLPLAVIALSTGGGVSLSVFFPGISAVICLLCSSFNMKKACTTSDGVSTGMIVLYQPLKGAPLFTLSAWGLAFLSILISVTIIVSGGLVGGLISLVGTVAAGNFVRMWFAAGTESHYESLSSNQV